MVLLTVLVAGSGCDSETAPAPGGSARGIEGRGGRDAAAPAVPEDAAAAETAADASRPAFGFDEFAVDEPPLATGDDEDAGEPRDEDAGLAGLEQATESP